MIVFVGGCSRQCIVDDRIQNFVDSGDFVKIDNSGKIIFIGREDRQVKRNGCRLNLREIEKVNVACKMTMVAVLF